MRGRKQRFYHDRPMSSNSLQTGTTIVIAGFVVGWIYNPWVGIGIVSLGLVLGLAMNRTGH